MAVTKQGSLVASNITWKEFSSVAVSYSILSITDVKVLPLGGFSRQGEFESVTAYDTTILAITKHSSEILLTADTVEFLFTKGMEDNVSASDAVSIEAIVGKFDAVFALDSVALVVDKEFFDASTLVDSTSVQPLYVFDLDVVATTDILTLQFTKGTEDNIVAFEYIDKVVNKEFFDSAAITDTSIYITPLRDISLDGAAVTDVVDILFTKAPEDVIVTSDLVVLTPIFFREAALNGVAFNHGLIG